MSARPGTIPLLCLHGGPGSSHAYFEPLEQLAGAGRQIVLYDQLGCGDSDRPDDPSLWSIELFVDEVRAVRDALGLERVHLLGTSWGGMLAQEYALTQAGGALLARPLVHPRERGAVGRRGRAAACRARAGRRRRGAHGGSFLPHRPAPAGDGAVAGEAESGRLRGDVGAERAHVHGQARGLGRDRRLGEIRVPTLIISGRYDMCTEAVADTLRQGIAGSEYVLFEHSAHVPVVEEPERYRAVVADFLGRVEAARL